MSHLACGFFMHINTFFFTWGAKTFYHHCSYGPQQNAFSVPGLRKKQRKQEMAARDGDFKSVPSQTKPLSSNHLYWI